MLDACPSGSCSWIPALHLVRGKPLRMRYGTEVLRPIRLWPRRLDHVRSSGSDLRQTAAALCLLPRVAGDVGEPRPLEFPKAGCVESYNSGSFFVTRTLPLSWAPWEAPAPI